ALPSEHLRVTHENIASMLGVRRESVTQALGKFQADGWVSNSRGKITIQDRVGLATQVCECFGIVKSETQRIFQRLVLTGSTSPARTVETPWAQGERAEEAVTSQQESIASPTDAAQVLLQKYQDVYDFAPVGFASLDVQGRVSGTNLAGAILLGVQRSHHQNPVLTSLLAAESREVFLAFQQEVLSGKCRRHCEVKLPATGHRAEVVLRLDATVDESGEEVQLVMTDITAEHQVMAQVLAQQLGQQALLDHSPFMLWGQDDAGRLVVANASLKALLGDAQPAPDGHADAALPLWLRDDHRESDIGELQEIPLQLNGQSRWFELAHARYQGPNQPALRLGYARDITERKLQEQRLRSLATLDSLTDLPNRRYFMSRMEEMYCALRRDPSQQAFVMLLDLDHFKNINDQFGRVAGDSVLYDFSRRLQACFQDSECVARLGSDDFGVLLHRTDTYDGQMWSERIYEQITGTAFEMDAQSIRLHVSLGIAPLLAVDESAQAAMLRADKALYQAKVGPHADGTADVFTVGYACDKETPDLFQWSSQGLRGASAQMGAGGALQAFK
ncbi:MAG: diguanylate cyclase, partial [Limnohabitans sp.]|nr:diguanylate cyclase [Limnohabitans sp.]